MLYLGIERRILFLFSGVFYENRVLPRLVAMGWEGFISPNLAMGRWMSGHLQRMTWPPSGCDFMLTFKQSGSPLPHLHWWRSRSNKSSFVLFGLVLSLLAGSVPQSGWLPNPQPLLPAWKQLWEEAAGAGNESAFSAPAQASISLSWHPVADGVNHLVTVPLIIYQLEKASRQFSYTRSLILRLLNWAEINSPTNFGIFSCKPISWAGGGEGRVFEWVEMLPSSFPQGTVKI